MSHYAEHITLFEPVQVPSFFSQHPFITTVHVHHTHHIYQLILSSPDHLPPRQILQQTRAQENIQLRDNTPAACPVVPLHHAGVLVTQGRSNIKITVLQQHGSHALAAQSGPGPQQGACACAAPGQAAPHLPEGGWRGKHTGFQPFQQADGSHGRQDSSSWPAGRQCKQQTAARVRLQGWFGVGTR